MPGPGLGLWGGCLGQHIGSGASCYPGLGSELRWAQPELQRPLLGNKYPCDNAKERDLWFANPLGCGWDWEPAGKLDVALQQELLSLGREEHSEPQEAQGWQGGFHPSCVLLS